jgi:hypothetical protein
VIPCLLFTYFAGPIGLLMYVFIRLVLLRRLSQYNQDENKKEKDSFLQEQLTVYFGDLDFWKRVFFITKHKEEENEKFENINNEESNLY